MVKREAAEIAAEKKRKSIVAEAEKEHRPTNLKKASLKKTLGRHSNASITAQVRKHEAAKKLSQGASDAEK